MYTYQNTKVGTRAVNVRLRRDLLDYLEMNCTNRSQLLNELLEKHCRRHQRTGQW